MSSRRKRAKQQPKRHIIPFAFILIVVVIVGLVGFTGAGAYAVVQSWLAEEMPSVDDASAFNTARKTRVWAPDGTLLAEFFAENREPVTADQVSPNVFNATVDVEDERFWEHRGVDYYGIARAAVNDLMGGEIQGASTITQQFIRQTVLKDEAYESTFRRKVREAYLATELEKLYTKEEVLMMYLNTINYGDGAWGIQSAAQHYFSKNASELSIPEAALIAGIPQNPTYNNPVQFPDNALLRRNMVLDRMYINGHITEEELNEAKAAELVLNVRDTTMDGIYAQPYFTTYVRKVLLEKLPYDQVFKDGLDVYTTIDPDMQYYAEEACAAKEAALYEQTGDPDIEVGLTCVDPNTGYILAMRGGKDFYEDQFNTAWQMKRQVGSSFKVFTLITAIEQGYSPQTKVSGASPLKIDLGDGNTWDVANYGHENMGVMSLAQATWRSSNTAYARVVRKIEAKPVQDTALRMGVASLDPKNAETDDERERLEHVGPSITLGAYGTNTLEMASAFGILATGGVRHEATPIAKIVDYNGNVIYPLEEDVQGEQVLTPEVAYATTEVLKGVVSGGTGTRANLGWQVSAGKTGTADDFKDSWFVGYTPQLSTAVWIGARGEPRYIADNAGGDNCCPVWRQFMENALYYYEAQDFPTASNPTYDPKATFMTAAEIKAEEDKRKAEEEERKKAEEEEEKRKAEEEAAQNPPSDPSGGDPSGGGTTPPDPGGGDPSGGGTTPPDPSGGTGGGGTGGGGSG
jgi:penicillin-binding protein 1A